MGYRCPYDPEMWGMEPWEKVQFLQEEKGWAYEEARCILTAREQLEYDGIVGGLSFLLFDSCEGQRVPWMTILLDLAIIGTLAAALLLRL